MSFNEIAEFRELLSRISRERPGLINAGKRSLLWAIISQSAGCFVGYEELADQAGLKPGTVKTYLRELTDLDLILREQSYVRKGIRQCYHVSLQGLRNLVRVSPVTPIEQDNALLGATESLKGVTESANGSNQSPTYREERDYKEERVKHSLTSFNLPRFEQYVTSSLLNEVRTLVTPGKNFEIVLDELESLGALKDVPAQLKSVIYDPSKNPGGLVLKVLNDLLTASKQRSERDRLDREHNQRVAQELEDVALNASSDPSKWIDEAKKQLAKGKEDPGVFLETLGHP
jgi:DNA-binding MarR family transcriptional regulator